jgi:anion-transporting  ArsA/GET3 family ATPase
VSTADAAGTARFAKLLAGSRIVVCVGSGGVGKTTIAAALALRGALEGRRSMVLTIDPARRLAQSLGVGNLRNGGEKIDAARFEEAGLHPRASLSAGMLDQTSAWDQFIARHSPNAEVRETILSNPFYQNLSRSFAGSTEYMAIEELCRIEETGEYDLIVLDTPPSRHALDFLEAPRRLEDFFDRSVLGWLARPASAGWTAWKTASRGARFVFERIEEATGLQTLTEIASFFAAIETLVDGVTARSRKVRELLQAPATAFVLVTGPDEQVLEDAEGLIARMQDLGVRLRGVVMNRVQRWEGLDEADDIKTLAGLARCGPGEDRGSPAAAGDRHSRCERLRRVLLDAGIAPDVAAWMIATLEAFLVQALAQAVRREAFEANLPDDVPIIAVSEQRHDVHDLAGLAAVAGALES